MIQDPDQLLAGVEWQTREAFQRLASAFESRTGLGLKVRSGARSCALQNTLYAQGRSSPGDIVTDAQGCNSWHVVGRAIDADPVDVTGVLSGLPADYALAGALWGFLGGVWGGNFPGFEDVGHFEFHPGIKIEQICPNPADCREGAIDTVGPAVWPWAAASAAVMGLAAWVLWPRAGRPWI